MKYGIIGVGALGGFYGGILANRGCDVHFLFHNDYNYVKENGLKIDSILGDFHLITPNVYSSSKDMPICDVVLVCLKTTNNHLLPSILKPITNSQTLVILIQNGLNIEKELACKMNDIKIAGGMAFICSNKISKGYISHLDYGKLTVGGYNLDVNAEKKLKQVAIDFEKTNIPFVITPDLNDARWRKLVWNIPYNGMCVALNTITKNIMANKDTRSLIKDLMYEVIEAGNKCGAHIEKSFADDMFDNTDKMSPYSPSMKLDYDLKRPLEIRAIYSNPLSISASNGYEMVKVKMLEQMLRFIEKEYLEIKK